MRKSLLPLIAIAILTPSSAFAQHLHLRPIVNPQASVQPSISMQQPAVHTGQFISPTTTPVGSTISSTQPWTGSTNQMSSINQFGSPARWSNRQPVARRQTLPPMVTRAPIMASPVLAAPMIMSVRGPERYNYASPTGYSPARGGFIFGRRGRR